MGLELPRIEPTDEILYDGERLRFDRQWGNGSLGLTSLRTGRAFLLDDDAQPTVDWFLTEMSEGQLRILSAKAPNARGPRPEVDGSDPRYAEALLVQFVLRTLDDAGCPKSNKPINRLLEATFTPEIIAKYGPMPPASTVRKWMSRGTRYRRSLKDCRSFQGQGERVDKLDPEVQKLRTDAALYYWSDRATTIEDAHAKLVQWVVGLNVDRAKLGLRKVTACTSEWLRRRINELETYESYRSKFGQKAADARFKADGIGTRSSQILELGIMDHWNAHSFCAIDELNGELLPVGPPTVTAIMDDYSRAIVAAVVHITPPSLHNSLDAIKWANRPKMRQSEVAPDKFELLASIYGKFDTILPDNAWEFVGSSNQDGLLDIGTSIDWSRAGEPRDKAKLERFWSTLNTYLAKKLPCATFEPKLMRELGYDPSKDKAILLADMRELVADAVAYYHIELHTGVNAQPARLWEKGVKARGAIPVIGDDRQIDQIMGKVEEATLTTAGVCLFGSLWYTDQVQVSAMLNRMAGTSPKGRQRRRTSTARVRVKVKYDPANLGAVQVYDHKLCDYIELPCREEYVRGLSLKHHQVLEQWTASQNLAFNTPEQRKLARATLNDLMAAAAPHVAMRHRKKFAALVATGVANAEPQLGEVAVAYAPSSYSGMAPVIAHDTAMATRTDEGRIPAGPPRHGRSRAAKPKQKALPLPTTGKPATFTRASAAKTNQTDDDWGGLR